MNWTLNSMQILTKQKLSSTLIRSCELCDRHIGVREVRLKSHWSMQSAIWQLKLKAQLFSTGVVREVCFGSCNAPVAALLFGVYFLFGREIQQNISGKRNSFLSHILAQLHLHVNSNVVHNS